MQNPYDVLGVSKTASQDEIKTAFRDAAKKHHPDRNSGNDVKFKEISAAYEVLSDPQKRADFDRGGSANSFFGQGNGFNPFGGDFFSNIFRQQRGSRQGIPGEDIEVEVELTFEESYKGCSKTINLDIRTPCNKCKGKGAETLKMCDACNGKGTQSFQQGPMVFTTDCNACHGSGSLESKVCDECSGSRYKLIEKIVEVDIPAGVDDGNTMRVANEGHKAIGLNGPDGSLFVNISVLEHDFFDRDGYDIICSIPVTYTELIFGKTKEIDLFGKKIKYDIAPLISPHSTIKLGGLGMPNPSVKNSKGNLLISMKLMMPKEITPEYKKVLDKLAKLEEKHE